METNTFSPTMAISREEFLKKGYYIGNLSEIIENVDDLRKIKDALIDKNKDEDSKKHFRCRYEYTNFTPMEYVHSIPVTEIEERRKLIEDNGYKTIQKWYEYCHQGQDEYVNLQKVLKNSIETFVPKIYPELSNGRLAHGDSLTLYENGDFIEPHVDHANPERFCVVLIYLSDEENYNDGGAELLVGVGEQNELVKPLFGTYVVLDFQKNGVLHAVEPVKNDFQRWTYINFIHIKNKI